MKVDTYDQDIALIGKCVLHPYLGTKCLLWRDKYYFLDNSSISNWIEDLEFYFTIEKSHAFDLKPYRK